MERQEFKKIFAQTLKANGFHKGKSRFYKDYGEVLTVIQLQKSNFGDYYYINYGYCIKKFTDPKCMPFPHESDAEIRRRILFKTCGNQDEIEYSNVAGLEFEKEFLELVKEQVLPPDDVLTWEWLIEKTYSFQLVREDIGEYLKSRANLCCDAETGQGS